MDEQEIEEDEKTKIETEKLAVVTKMIGRAIKPESLRPGWIIEKGYFTDFIVTIPTGYHENIEFDKDVLMGRSGGVYIPKMLIEPDGTVKIKISNKIELFEVAIHMKDSTTKNRRLR